jgi:hypothetical protein
LIAAAFGLRDLAWNDPFDRVSLDARRSTLGARRFRA